MEQYQHVTAKWRGMPPYPLEVCPSFENPARLICWAYELLLDRELDLIKVSTFLKVLP